MKRRLMYIVSSIVLVATTLTIVISQNDPAHGYFRSLFVRGTATFHGKIAGDNTSAATNLIALTNEDGTARLTVDSSGAGTFAGSVTASSFSGAFSGTTFSGTTVTGTVATFDSINSKVGLFGRRHADASVYPLIVANYAGTTKASIDTAGNAVVVALTATGTITATSQSLAIGSIGAHSLTGKVTPTDSTIGVLAKSSDGRKWLIRVHTDGAIVADSAGQN